MFESSNTRGSHIKVSVLLHCYGCRGTVSCSPGSLSEDGTIEYRTCEEGHTVPDKAQFGSME
ncbi:hypothetical protein SAMN04489740_2528 [Arthrobacter alpinus]|uniref:Uncharacterized protein n=1 Tax=Arthrobacter alpinus TaxID=656366 RepID=A0A1H5LPX0_9MICC|nr:hypothetical protein SAMN04489740_2528 [Arthrobacter alpinus]